MIGEFHHAKFPILKFDGLEQSTRFKSLKAKEFARTQVADESLLSLWRIRGDVNNIANHLHVRKVLTIRKRTYKCIILEFLSSLEVTKGNR